MGKFGISRMFSILYMICILRINNISGIGISGMLGIAGRCICQSAITVQLQLQLRGTLVPRPTWGIFSTYLIKTERGKGDFSEFSSR
jgi:hypothetical protein